jgi:hypothetical protein
MEAVLDMEVPFFEGAEQLRFINLETIYVYQIPETIGLFA